ncbi:MAG: signal peptide peptidase SppA [Bacteroidota bacterium]|nr:signal peptide peptidase SppA [Bacteroidota bacterium]
MRQFFKFLFASCLGTFLALVLLFFIIVGIGTSMNKSGFGSSGPKSITTNSVLKISIPDQLPEQTNNIQLEGFSFADKTNLGIHDYAKVIHKAAADPNIKGIYLLNHTNNHGYASLKIIRDALIEFKKSGKFIISFGKFLDHKNYYLASVSDQIYFHPLGFIDLKGFDIVIPFFKELMEKIGLKFNIYYAGEFKSATESFRLSKMSPENKFQLNEYLMDQYNLYLDQVSEGRNIPKEILKTNFDQFLSYTPQKALENNLIDSLAHETDVFQYMRMKMNIEETIAIHFITPEDYYSSKGIDDADYGSNNRIAVVFAEGNIIDSKGNEGEIGKKYVDLLRDIRDNKNIKSVVLRINSGGGSALMSDDILKELDIIRAKGKPVVVSMGDYAASGGYYIACHADSIFASAHTLTGSIGVFAMIPNINVMTDQKIGIDWDSLGTGPMSTKFNPLFNWTGVEAKVLQENIDHTYDRFLSLVAQGRKMDKAKVHEIAKGRIWSGRKAKEIGLVNEIGELNDAIKCAARLASLDKYRISEYPTQLDPFQKIIERFKGGDEDINSSLKTSLLKSQLGDFYPYYKEWQEIQQYKGAQMRLPWIIEIQ